MSTYECVHEKLQNDSKQEEDEEAFETDIMKDVMEEEVKARRNKKPEIIRYRGKWIRRA